MCEIVNVNYQLETKVVLVRSMYECHLACYDDGSATLLLAVGLLLLTSTQVVAMSHKS